jgi:hypothetical protein
VVEAADGRLWFATTKGIAWLDPATLERKIGIACRRRYHLRGHLKRKTYGGFESSRSSCPHTRIWKLTTPL